MLSVPNSIPSPDSKFIESHSQLLTLLCVRNDLAFIFAVSHIVTNPEADVAVSIYCMAIFMYVVYCLFR